MGDATPAGSSKTASHTYATAETRNVTLTVTDAPGDERRDVGGDAHRAAKV